MGCDGSRGIQDDSWFFILSSCDWEDASGAGLVQGEQKLRVDAMPVRLSRGDVELRMDVSVQSRGEGPVWSPGHSDGSKSLEPDNTARDASVDGGSSEPVSQGILM